MKFVLMGLFLFLGIKSMAGIVSETALSDYDSAESVLIVKPQYFSDHPPGGLQNIISVVKGPTPVMASSQEAVVSIPSDASFFFLFLTNRNGRLSPINGDGYAIGFSGLPRDAGEVFKKGGMIHLLAASLPNETAPECIWQQAYLLSRFRDSVILKNCWDLLNKKENPTPPTILATALIGVMAVGNGALAPIHRSVLMPNKGDQDFFENQASSMLGSWIQNNANRENHKVILDFTRWQRGRLRASGLSGISRYVVQADLPAILDIFMHEEDPLAQYACLQSLSTIYDMVPTVPGYPVFLQNRDALVAQWKKIIQSPPPE